MTIALPKQLMENYSQGVGTRIIISERKTKARPLITCFKSGKELKTHGAPIQKVVYIYMYIAACYKSVRNMNSFSILQNLCLFAFLAYYSTQTESLLSFVDMPGSWGLVGVKKSQHAWLGGCHHDLIHIKKTRGLNCTYSI